MGEEMVLQKFVVPVFCFCIFGNVITALPPPVPVTTKWPSLIGSNPKCPAVPLWKDLAPTIQELAVKNVISPVLYRKILKTLEELIKDCENKVVELKAVDIDDHRYEEVSAKDKETDKDVDINTSELIEANKDGDSELGITEANELENMDSLLELRSLFEKLPAFIPIFKPRISATIRKINSTHNFDDGNSTINLKTHNDSEFNKLILHFTKTAKLNPEENIMQISKRLQNTENSLSSTEISASIEVNSNIFPIENNNEIAEPLPTVLSTGIPKSNVIHFSSIRRPTLLPNSINTPKPLSYVPTNPIHNSPLRPVVQNASPIIPVQTDAGSISLFDNIISNSLSSNSLPNSPCSKTVPENHILSVVPITSPGNTHFYPNSILSKNAQSPCSCAPPPNTATPMPNNLIALNIGCAGKNRKCNENTEKPNVVFFKPEDVEVLNVAGDTLKKTKITLLVPAYVTQIDV